MKNKLNFANLPYLLTIGLFFIVIVVSSILPIINNNLVLTILEIFLLTSFIVFILMIIIACPISLFFQIRNKNKTKLDKILITLNSFGIFLTIFTVIFIKIAFPNIFVTDSVVRTQIENEIQILEKEYQPVLNYLVEYKKANGIYPETIKPELIQKSDVFENYFYSVQKNKKGYWLEVYPKNGPIEYYYNDENDNGNNYYNGNGHIDSVLTNFDYYEIDKNWHAIKSDLMTRHSKFTKNFTVDNDTEIYLKNNIDKFQ